MNGPLRYRNVTDSHQDKWRYQHNYKETTPPHGNNYHTNTPYECRIDWTREGTEILKQRSLEYIRSQPDDLTYHTDGSSNGARVVAAVVHMEEEIIIRLNDSASALDAEMTAIRVAQENASETRDKITIHTYSLTAVNIVNNRKLNLNTITRAIRDAASRLTQRPTINWIPAHTGTPGNENAHQAAKTGLQLDRIHITVNGIAIAILNSQNAVSYEEITGLLRNFLFMGQIRKHN